MSSLLVVHRVTKRDWAEVVGNRSSTRIANEFDRSVGQIDVAQFASQGRRPWIVKHKELGARSSLGLVTYVFREVRIAKLHQLKGYGPLSGNDTPNIGFRRRSILHGRRVDWQSRAFDEFAKDLNLSRGLFRLGVVGAAQNWLRLFSRMFESVMGEAAAFAVRKSILRCPRFILNERPPAGPLCLISNEIVLHETEAPAMGKISIVLCKLAILVPDSRFHAISAWIAACDPTLIGPFGATSANTEREGGLSEALPAPGAPNSPRRASISPGCTNVRPAALGKLFGENSGLPTEAPWPSPIISRPGRIARASDKISPSLIAYQAILHSKAKRLLARRKFLERSTGGVWVFLPIAVKRDPTV
jgi:hypothetical protein